MARAGSDRDGRPFRPRLLRGLCYFFAPIVVAAYAALSVGLSLIDWKPWHLYDMLWMTGLGLVFAWVVYRCGSISTTAYSDCLRVRNVFKTRDFAWAEVIDARLTRSDSWAHLDLSSGDTYPVMAIQMSDGAHAHREIERLRRLIHIHTTKGLS